METKNAMQPLSKRRPATTNKLFTMLGVLIVGAVWVGINFPALAQYAPPPSGLVSWWRGDGNANDSADGNNGVPLNGAGYTTGVFGSAFWFDGINDHVRIADSSNLRITSAITLSAWVNISSYTSYNQIMSKWDAIQGPEQRSYAFAIRADGVVSFGLTSSGLEPRTEIVSNSQVPLNTWTHVAATYDGSLIKIYVNGSQEGQVSKTGGIFAGSDDLCIGGVVGGVSVGNGISFFHGGIDEALIYNRALSTGEIAALAVVPEPSSASIMLLASLGMIALKNRCYGVRESYRAGGE